jgi:hypothetical protein
LYFIRYEKWAIDKWLNTQQTSPITGLILTDNTLISNYTLKSALDDFAKRQNKLRKHKIDLQKFLTKCEYDLSDLKKYFNSSIESSNTSNISGPSSPGNNF